MARVVFFARVKRELLDTVEFYKQDIEALKDIGHDVVIATRLREIPLTFDYMFIWWWTHAALPIIVSKVLRRTSIVTGTFNFKKQHGGVDYFSRPWWERALIRYAVTYTEKNLFVSRYEKTLCQDYFDLDNAVYCPHVLHDDYLQGPGPKRELAILTIAWSSKENLRRKGVPVVLEAIAILKARGHRIPAYVAGHEGNGSGWLRELVEEYGIQENVELLGEISREEKLHRLRACELYVQPSFYEGFGLAQAEAMGSGACVITCRVGAVGEVVGKAGIYVEPGSAVALADAVENVVSDPGLRKEYQQRAVERMRSKYSAVRKRAFLEKMFSELEENQCAR